MKLFLLFIILGASFQAKSQNWTSWQSVSHGIEISFKYSKYDGCSDYHFVRIRNTSSFTYCYVKVSFDTYCKGKKNQYRETIAQNNMKPGEILESRGNWFLGTGGVYNIKLDRLTDVKCNKIVSQ